MQSPPRHRRATHFARRACAVLTTLGVTLIGSFFLLTQAAEAHTPSISATCETGITASATGYSGSGTVTAVVDSTVDTKDFTSGGATAHVDVPQDGKPHTWSASVKSNGNEASTSDSDTIGPCGETTPTPSESVTPTPSESITPTPSESITPSPSESITPTPSNSVGPPPSTPPVTPTPPAPTPPKHKVQCSDYSSGAAAQTAYENGATWLDGNGDGIACNALHHPPNHLPNTGGPTDALLGGGIACVLAGLGTMFASRRRSVLA